MFSESRSRTSTGKYKRSEFLIFEHKSLNGDVRQEPIRDSPQRLIHTGKPTMDKPSKVNLRLVTKESSNEREETTTPPKELIWPDKLSDRHRQSIVRLVSGVDFEIVQQILDEIENTTKTVRNPVGYFHDLLSKFKAGDYVPSGAISQTDQRESKKRVEDRSEAMRQESIRRGEEFLAKYSKALPD